MEPEIHQGDRVVVTLEQRRAPALGEIVIGYLKSKHFVFGVYNTPVYEAKRGLWQIRPISRQFCFPPSNYLEEHFAWIYPISHIESFDADMSLGSIKRLQYAPTTEVFDSEGEGE
jgi:hypothetical protein